MTSVAMGTPGYVAPETLEHGSSKVDHRADIYALGVMLYEMLTGSVPMGAFKPVTQKVPKLRVDSRIDEVVSRAMEPDMESRYQSAAELSTEIEAITSGKIDPKGAKTESGKEKRGTPAGAIAAVVIVLLTLGGGGTWWWMTQNAEGTREDVPTDGQGTGKAMELAEARKTGQVPRIEVATALAAMKQRGGRLRTFGRTAAPTQPKVNEVDDLVSLFRSYDYWTAIGANGAILAPWGQTGPNPGLVKPLRGSGLFSEGRFQRNEDADPIEGVRDFFVGDKLFFTHFEDGRVEVGIHGEEALSNEQQEVVDLVRGLRGVRLFYNRTNHDDGVAVLENGQIYFWEGNLRAEPDIDGSDLLEIITVGAQTWVGRRPDGTVQVWSDLSAKGAQAPREALQDPRIPGPAFALRGESGVAVVQLEDGSWYAWGNSDRQGGIDEINQLGPAVDLQFELGANGGWWLEPADAESASEPELTVPTLELPSVLAAMKQRGGRVQGWGTTPDGEDIVAKFFAETDHRYPDDFTQVCAVADGNWRGLRRVGALGGYEKSFQNMLQIRDFELAMNGRVGIVLEDGTARIGGYGKPKVQPPHPDLIAISIGQAHAYVLDRTGKAFLVPLEENAKDSMSQWKQTEELLARTGDLVQIETHLDLSVALNRRGEVLTWSTRKANVPSPPEDLDRIVEVAVGNGHWLSLDDSGAVTAWGDNREGQSDIPPDLPPAVAVRARDRLSAAQLRDGSWRAWCDDSNGVVSRINELGPAIDLVFTRHFVYWIEPADAISPKDLPLKKITPNPAAATKDQPFANTLGMTFVPVPIGNGPSAGERVLFCRHETRWKDYAAFAEANEGVDESWKIQVYDGYDVTENEERPEDHPVTKVSWEDAQAFCAWLTEKERAAGRLPEDMAYRLPTDLEWSWAVGIGDREDPEASPKERREQMDGRGLGGVYPWKGGWPPPTGAANVSDQSRKEEAPNSDEKVQYAEDYDDGYPATSPVMAFAGSELGLFDLGGNVREWCEDEDGSNRVNRGGSWFNNARHCRAANRWNTPSIRNNYLGFRSVLAKVAATLEEQTTRETAQDR